MPAPNVQCRSAFSQEIVPLFREKRGILPGGPPVPVSDHHSVGITREGTLTVWQTSSPGPGKVMNPLPVPASWARLDPIVFELTQEEFRKRIHYCYRLSIPGCRDNRELLFRLEALTGHKIGDRVGAAMMTEMDRVFLDKQCGMGSLYGSGKIYPFILPCAPKGLYEVRVPEAWIGEKSTLLFHFHQETSVPLFMLTGRFAEKRELLAAVRARSTTSAERTRE